KSRAGARFRVLRCFWRQVQAASGATQAMFEKYNEKARRALFFARYEASKLGSKVIESEHILLGVLREGEEIIKEIFSRFNVKPEQIRREVEGDRLFV